MVSALLLGASAPAVPAPSDPVWLEQPDGTRFEARLQGDEFFAWHETPDGHPVEKDPASGCWRYSRNPGQPQARLPLNPAIVGEDAAPADPWTPTEGPEATRARQAATEARLETLDSNLNAARIRKRSPDRGPEVKKLLTVCVRFSDSPAATALTPVDYFRQKIYGVTSDPSVVKHTVADYYLDVSGNRLLVSGEARGWVDLPLRTADYGANLKPFEPFDYKRLRNLLRDTVAALNEDGFDFGPFDSDNDGRVDMLAIVFQGLGEADGGGPETIWPHQFSYNDLRGFLDDNVPLNTGDKNASGSDVMIDLYFTSAELNLSSADRTKSVSAPIGTFCHEFAHAIGLPDLYDRSAPKSAGLGKWSLMANGSYNQARGQAGDCPAWPDAYSRGLAGWDNPVNITSNTLRARIPEAKGPERTVYRLWSQGIETSQCFLIESRRRTGFDLGLPGEGLLVYHVSMNEQALLNQNDVEWHLWPTPRTEQGHYLVALEQADGRFDLEQTKGSTPPNRGDASDAFGSGQEFSDTTLPSSKAYPDWGQPGEGPSTHVAVRNIDTSQTDASYADLFVFEDQQRPQVTITTPAAHGAAIGELFEATGNASDHTGVTELRAWLSEEGPGGRMYDWSSGQWLAEPGPGSAKEIEPLPSWSLPLPDAAFADGTYRLTVHARDASGLQSEPAVVRFTIARNLVYPSLVIRSPAGERYARPPWIQGDSATPGESLLTSRRFALYSESLGRWYHWSQGAFDQPSFDFGKHVFEVRDDAAAWHLELPSSLGNGRYQVHAQSVNDSNRASPWTNAGFVLMRSPDVAVASVAHQALLQAMPSLYGAATPQSGYELREVRITIYRNGHYWNGTDWQEEAFHLVVMAPPAGGPWTYQGTLPSEDGLYAVSVSAIDTEGSFSEPIAGGNPGQNQLLFRVDSSPPSLEFEWPPDNHVHGAKQLDGGDITGSTSDGSGRPSVRVRLKRLEDGLYWSRYGWTSSDSTSWHQASFPGGDGGSQTRWVMEAELPDAGGDPQWCLANGSYVLEAEARDLVGNVTRATRGFEVSWLDPLLAGTPDSSALPRQQAIGPAAETIRSSTLATSSFRDGDGAHEAHALIALPGRSFGIVASSINTSLGYDTSREPWIAAVDGDGTRWVHRRRGKVIDPEDNPVDRSSLAPVADFHQDGSAVCASELMRYNFSIGRFQLLDQCEVVSIGPEGSERWQRILPDRASTRWRMGAAGSTFRPMKTSVLPDGTILLVGHLEAHDIDWWSQSQIHFRSHVMVMRINRDGSTAWTRRFGLESEDPLLHENEKLIALEPDSHGSLFLATRRTKATGPWQLLRKLRMSDGAILAELGNGPCSIQETWGALAVDAYGRPILASACRFGADDTRISVRRLAANDLATDWHAFGPPRSAAMDAWTSKADIPLVSVDAGGVTVVCNSAGINGRNHDGDDLIVVTRVDAGGVHQWSREVDGTGGLVSLTGAHADHATSTPTGDILLTGWFGKGGHPWMRGYAKVSANGDLQFVKNLSDEFDLSGAAFLSTALSSDGAGLAALYLDSGDSGMQVRLLDNPSNRIAPPDLGSLLPLDASVASGDTVVLEAANSGSPATYQWYRSTLDGEFEPLPGATRQRLVITNAGSADVGQYRVIATNPAGQSTSRDARVSIVTAAPRITSALDVTAYVGEYLNYQAIASPAADSYRIDFDPDQYPVGLFAMPDGGISGFPLFTGTFEIRITATNALGSDTQTLRLIINERPVVTLGDALDAPTLAWTTSPSPDDWQVQDYEVIEGSHALHGFAAPGGSSWIETTVEGPGTLDYHWAAQIATVADGRLALYLDGVLQTSIQGGPYRSASLTIPPGTHAVRWTLEADIAAEYTLSGWIDRVNFQAAPATGFDAWAAQQGLTGDDAMAEATPMADGIPNLLKYAFGMDAKRSSIGADRVLAPGVGKAGLPDVRLAEPPQGRTLRVEFVRRRNARDLSYSVQFTRTPNHPGSWEDAGPQATTIVNPVDAEWERVVVEEHDSTADATRRFARVLVTRQP